MRVLVTGSSSGFGLLTAVELATRGHAVVASMRDPDRSAALLEAASAARVALSVVVLDVDDPASVEAGVAAAVVELGGLDAVVSNAGTELRGPVEALTDDELRAQMETNVLGFLRVLRAVAPRLRTAGGGTIVAVSSIAGVIARPFAGGYAASKHALEALAEAAHFELGPDGIRVHLIQPGQFPTGLSGRTQQAAAFGPGSPLWDLAERVEIRAKALAGAEPPAPVVVARTIAEVLADPTAPLRVPVGSDAELILAAREGRSFEDYEILMRAALDLWDGYRRERPA